MIGIHLFRDNAYYWTRSWVVFMMFLTTSVSQHDNGIREYCVDDSFDAVCGDNEVILMTRARYGRMRIGDCAPTSLGYIGCDANAIPVVDSWCSGHRECQLSIMDPGLRALKPCPSGLTSHLEASYDCIQVATRGKHECHQGSHAEIDEPFSYLSSEYAMTNGVGSPSCPWRVVAPVGQAIRVTLHNFARTSLGDAVHSGSNTATCVTVATLEEKQSPHKLISACDNGPRTQTVYESRENILSISFPNIPSSSEATKHRTQFLLEYQFVGCPDIPQKDGTAITRTSDMSRVKCVNTGETWSLQCVESHWVGTLGNCTKTTAQPWTIGNMFDDDSSFPFGILIVVAVGVALGIFLGGTLLLVVSVYLKRRRRLQGARAIMRADPRDYQGPALTADEYYRKQQELADFEHREDTLNSAHGGRLPAEEYKISEYRPQFPPGICPPGVHSKNMHHLYESPKFT